MQPPGANVVCDNIYVATTATCSACYLSLQARDEADNPRLSGGDVFKLLLLPGRPSSDVAVQAESAAVQAESAAQGGITTTELKAVIEGRVIDKGDGSYCCSYSHTLAGPHELHILDGTGTKCSNALPPGVMRIITMR
jgi:hypothetical protein